MESRGTFAIMQKCIKDPIIEAEGNWEAQQNPRELREPPPHEAEFYCPSGHTSLRQGNLASHLNGQLVA